MTTSVTPCCRCRLIEQVQHAGPRRGIEIAGRFVGQQAARDRWPGPGRWPRVAARPRRAWGADARCDATCRPVSSNASALLARCRAGNRPANIGICTFSRAVKVGSKWNDWKTKPSVLRPEARRVGHAAPATGRRRISLPGQGGPGRRSGSQSVDLPLPLGPMIARYSPRPTVSETSRRACTAPSSNCRLTASIRNKGSAVCTWRGVEAFIHIAGPPWDRRRGAIGRIAAPPIAGQHAYRRPRRYCRRESSRLDQVCVNEYRPGGQYATPGHAAIPRGNARQREQQRFAQDQPHDQRPRPTDRPENAQFPRAFDAPTSTCVFNTPSAERNMAIAEVPLAIPRSKPVSVSAATKSAHRHGLEP